VHPDLGFPASEKLKKSLNKFHQINTVYFFKVLHEVPEEVCSLPERIL
jgi:hypothetical protein